MSEFEMLNDETFVIQNWHVFKFFQNIVHNLLGVY